MPYITNTEKSALDLHGQPPLSVGELTYALTREAVKFKQQQDKIHNGLRFVTIALVMGAFFCAALEFYRRVAIPYENGKMAVNGDVYD